MSPVSSEPSLNTMRWVVVSLFFHTTVEPWLTLAGLGEKDCAPSMPTMVMVTVPPPPPPPGEGWVGLELPPQLHIATASPSAAVVPTRNRMVILLWDWL